jgi:hypothetical protein
VEVTSSENWITIEMVSSDIVTESRSWGEMVRSIDAERRTLPWASNEFVRSETATLAEVLFDYGMTEVRHRLLIMNIFILKTLRGYSKIGT